MKSNKLGIWFPTVRTGTGTDVFTERLVEGLMEQGIRAEITWLPLRAEYMPWSIAIPQPPDWATIVHVNTWLHSRFLPKNLPIIATLHHSIHDPNLRPHKGWLRAMYHQYWIAPNERRVMQQATQVTAVSQFVADMAKRTLCNVPIQVIYNGIDTELFCSSNRIRQKGEQFQILYIGSWIRRKGVDLLPSIMCDLGTGFELYYTGDAAAEKDKFKMPNNMHDLGRLNQHEVIQEMQKSDLLLLPSRSEGLPLVAIEAMACGLPVVAMKGTAVEEVVEHEITGFLAEYEDIHNMQIFIKSLSMNPELLAKLSKSTREVVCTKFSAKKMIENYSNIYHFI